MATIEKRGENSYRFTVYLPRDANGKYPKKYKTIKVEGKYTPKQLKEYLEGEYLKFKNEVLSGNYVEIKKMKFTDFVQEWKKKYAEKELSGTTVRNHRFVLERHILPVIGHMYISDINTMMLLDLLDNLKRHDRKDGKLSTYRVIDVYRTLRSIFKWAKEWKVITDDPTEGIKKPKLKDDEKHNPQVYDEYEVYDILQLLQNEPIHWRAFMTLAITAGTRRGENLGLEWSDIDFENNTISINKSIVIEDSGPVVKSPKTKKSKRIISLPPSVMEELKEYRKYWIETKLKRGEKWIEHERQWLFHKFDGTFMYPTSPSSWWRKFTANNGIRHIRLHDLRHTSASLLIAQGIHEKIISERLGHSTIKTTMDIYGHVIRAADQAAANTFESLFQPKSQIK